MAYRKITIENKSYITPLQMFGPVVNPISVSDSIVIELVRKGYTVNEKLRNGKTVRLNMCNMRQPYASVSASTTVKTTGVNPVTPITKPTTQKPTPAPVEETKVEKPEIIDDGIRDYGEPVSEISVVPAAEPFSPKIIEAPPTPEESGISIMTVQDVKTEEAPVEPESYDMPEDVLVDVSNAVDESAAEALAESEEPTTDSNNQARKNKKKKRR